MSRRIVGAWLVSLCALGAFTAHADALGPEAAQQFSLTDFVTSLGPVTDFRFLPDGRMVIVQKTGEVQLRRTTGVLVNAGALNVDTAGDNGLLAVEVDPAFSTNGFLYMYWSRSTAAGGTDQSRHRVSRFTLNGEVLDTTSELVLVDNLRGPDRPGGGLALGADGMLYVGVGDSGCGAFGTCLTNGNGKVLRVMRDGTQPTSNPLANETAVTSCGTTCTSPDAGNTSAPRKDIFAWGLRNPFRLWVDPSTGNVWVGDIGETEFEEVNVARAGDHLGWPLREGASGQAVTECAALTPQSGDCLDPVYVCRHGGADGGVDGNCAAVTGGLIVDACTWPSPWRGRYVFGDRTNGQLYYLTLNAGRDGVAPDAGTGRGAVGTINPGAPVSFQVGPDNNLYIAVQSGTSGRIVQITPLLPATCTVQDGGTELDGGEDAGTEVDGGEDAGKPSTPKDQIDTTPPHGEPFDPKSGCNCSSGLGAFPAVLILGMAGFYRQFRRHRKAGHSRRS